MAVTGIIQHPTYQPHILASNPTTFTLKDGTWVPENETESITIPNTPVITHLDPPHNNAPNDVGSLDAIDLFVKGHNRRLSVYPNFNDDKVYANSYYYEGVDKTPNTITGYDPVNWKYGIRINGAKKDEWCPDKILAAQGSLYIDYYNEHYAFTCPLLLAPEPNKRTNPYQSLLNGACMWFSCDVRGSSSISIRDINGMEGIIKVKKSHLGYTS
ncbi:MAG: hypothetical protein AAB267_05740 [Candidatus Desantisbacteria bacterium]